MLPPDWIPNLRDSLRIKLCLNRETNTLAAYLSHSLRTPNQQPIPNIHILHNDEWKVVPLNFGFTKHPHRLDNFFIAFRKDRVLAWYEDMHFLIDVFADGAQDQRIGNFRQLVKQLGNDAFEVREAATQELILTGQPLMPFLREIADSTKCPETRTRLYRVFAAWVREKGAPRVLTVGRYRIEDPMCLGVTEKNGIYLTGKFVTCEDRALPEAVLEWRYDDTVGLLPPLPPALIKHWPHARRFVWSAGDTLFISGYRNSSFWRIHAGRDSDVDPDAYRAARAQAQWYANAVPVHSHPMTSLKSSAPDGRLLLGTAAGKSPGLLYNPKLPVETVPYLETEVLTPDDGQLYEGNSWVQVAPDGRVWCLLQVRRNAGGWTTDCQVIGAKDSRRYELPIGSFPVHCCLGRDGHAVLSSISAEKLLVFAGDSPTTYDWRPRRRGDDPFQEHDWLPTTAEGLKPWRHISAEDQYSPPTFGFSFRLFADTDGNLWVRDGGSVRVRVSGKWHDVRRKMSFFAAPRDGRSVYIGSGFHASVREGRVVIEKAPPYYEDWPNTGWKAFHDPAGNLWLPTKQRGAFCIRPDGKLGGAGACGIPYGADQSGVLWLAGIDGTSHTGRASTWSNGRMLDNPQLPVRGGNSPKWHVVSDRPGSVWVLLQHRLAHYVALDPVKPSAYQCRNVYWLKGAGLNESRLLYSPLVGLLATGIDQATNRRVLLKVVVSHPSADVK